LIFAALMLVMLGATAIRLAYDFVEANSWVRHTENVMATVRATRALLGISRLPISNQKQATVAAIRTQLDRIAQLTRDNPLQQANLADLRKTIALPPPSPSDPTTAFKTHNPEALNDALDRMQREEYGLLLARSGAEVQAMQRAGIAVIALCAGLLSLGAFTTLAARKEYLRREKIESILRIDKRELTRYTEELALISKGSEVIQAAQIEAQLTASVATVLDDLLPGSSGFLGLIGPAIDNVQVAESWGETIVSRSFPASCCAALETGKPVHAGGRGQQVRCAHVVQGDLDSLCVPIRGTDGLLGVLHVESPVPLMRRHVESIALFAAHVALGLTNLRVRQVLHGQSMRDALTGLFNRRYFDDTLERELAISRRDNTALSVLLLDLDHFKRINDMQGHAAGDEALRAFAELMGSAFRESDVICRYGGEEFAVILIHTGLQDAYARAESFRKLVAQSKLIDNGAVTTSIGLACSSEFHVPSDLLHGADTALYHAKESGRNATSIGTAQVDSLDGLIDASLCRLPSEPGADGPLQSSQGYSANPLKRRWADLPPSLG
jgi:diguanylate cyclase (GGDEF)-like protein